MSALQSLTEVFGESGCGGNSERYARELLAELRREDAARLLTERRQYASRWIFSDGIKRAADLLTQWADDAEKDTSVGSQPPAGESTSDAAELLAHASAFEIPRPGNTLPLLLQRSYGHADRWAILNRDGRCWDRDFGGQWVPHWGGIADDRRRDSARFTLAEAWPLAHRLAAGETAAHAADETLGEDR